MYRVDRKYGVPIDDISCPGCGQRYGHHNTKVDKISQECSSCVKLLGYKVVNFVYASDFIENILGFKPYIN